MREKIRMYTTVPAWSCVLLQAVSATFGQDRTTTTREKRRGDGGDSAWARGDKDDDWAGRSRGWGRWDGF